MMEDRYLAKALALMSKFGICARDTYRSDANWDDFYSNGDCYNGPRLFKIEWADTIKYAKVEANKKYSVPNFNSVAYDAYRLVMPERYRSNGRDDPIIHECVHFLQHNTMEEDNNYINFDGHNYIQYVSQRVELEAHIVQVAYIFEDCRHYRDSILDTIVRTRVQKMLDKYENTPDESCALSLILECKGRNLI